MALFKAVVWALIFLTKLRFPPGVSIAIVLLPVYHLRCFLDNSVSSVQVYDNGNTCSAPVGVGEERHGTDDLWVWRI